MASVTNEQTSIQHPGEDQSNDLRRRLTKTEPLALRTYTSSLALLDHSAGSYHWTPEGRKLADFSSGVLVANLGHNPRRWWRRLLDYLHITQLESAGEFIEAAPLTAYNAVTSLEVQANERLLACLRNEPGGGRMEQVLWAASGSEAIQKSLWAALDQDPGRNMIIATRDGFHGKKGLAGAVTGSESDKERDPRVRFISFPKFECSDVDRRREPLDVEPYQQKLNKLAEELGDRICCLITEPYLGVGGSYQPQPEYLQMLKKFYRDHNALFILDEIQANFGRTGPMFAYTHYGLEPDIVCLGKGLGNGVPVSAAVGRADVFAAMHYGEGSDTWSANPLSCAAVLATLDEFAEGDVIAKGQTLAPILEAGLIALKATGLIANVRGEGCVWGIECAGVGSCEPEEVANHCVEACYRGDSQGRAIHLLGPLAGRVLRISPPLTMPPDELRNYLDALRGIFANLRLKLG